MKLEDAIRSFTSRAGVVRVRNALNPLLWLCGLVTPTCWIAAYFFRDDPVLKYLLFGLGALSILSALVAYFVLMFRDPDRLQSEEFILRQQELLIISRSREGLPQPIEAEGRELPNVIELESREGEPS